MPNDVFNQPRANAPIVEIPDHHRREVYHTPFVKPPQEKRMHGSKALAQRNTSVRDYADYAVFLAKKASDEQQTTDRQVELTREQTEGFAQFASDIGLHLQFRREQHINLN